MSGGLNKGAELVICISYSLLTTYYLLFFTHYSLLLYQGVSRRKSGSGYLLILYNALITGRYPHLSLTQEELADINRDIPLLQNPLFLVIAKRLGKSATAMKQSVCSFIYPILPFINDVPPLVSANYNVGA